MKFSIVTILILWIVSLISILEAKIASTRFVDQTKDDLIYDRQIVGETFDDNGAIDIEEVRNDIFSPTGLVSQLGQNFVQWFSSSLFLTFLIPFNLAGNKRKLSRTKRSRGNGETLPWYFSMKQMSALMRAIADVADNYNRYKDEL